jgi:uncharacterized repeat protein (TIGR03987 family)
MLAVSIILINLALVIYTISIWNESRCKNLKLWHAVMFCGGFIFDVAGTFMMYKIGGSKIRFGLHDILGYLALLLMLCNAAGAVFILAGTSKKLKESYYKFGIFAWIIWIVSYIAGMVVNM